MKTNDENVVDQNGFEIHVEYNYEISDSQIEEGHGFHEVGRLVYTELTSVKLLMEENALDLLPLLNDKQKSYIISKLYYNE